MVTVDRRPGVLPRDLTATSFANPHIDGAHCGIVYLECSRCGRYVGAQDGDGFSGSVACICMECQARSTRRPEAINPVKAGLWSYRVPCAGVKYYSFE